MSFGDGLIEMKDGDDGFAIVVREGAAIDLGPIHRYPAVQPGPTGFHIPVPQVEREGSIVDGDDRVAIGVEVAHTLAAAVSGGGSS